MLVVDAYIYICIRLAHLCSTYQPVALLSKKVHSVSRHRHPRLDVHCLHLSQKDGWNKKKACLSMLTVIGITSDMVSGSSASATASGYGVVADMDRSE